VKAARLMMRGVVAHVCAAVLLTTAQADQPAIPRIGVLAAPLPYEQGLRDGLVTLGYVEGKSIAIDWRRSGGAVDELRSLATDLANSKPGLVVAFGTPAALAALEVATVPIVFLSGDPVASGLVTNLARPGGNATGVSATGVELTGKRMQLLLEFAPRARRIGCLVNTSNPIGALQLEQARKAARSFNVELVKFDARNDAQVDAAVRTILRSALDGLLVTGDNLMFANSVKVARAIHKTGLPAIYPTRETQGDEGLVSYGPSLKEAGRMSAVYVDKILRGAKPGDLPIEQVSKLELVIDLRVARAQGIKVPEELLYRADEVIR
jgi:putative ABC transport system substrate-binding protein